MLQLFSKLDKGLYIFSLPQPTACFFVFFLFFTFYQCIVGFWYVTIFSRALNNNLKFVNINKVFSSNAVSLQQTCTYLLNLIWHTTVQCNIVGQAVYPFVCYTWSILGESHGSSGQWEGSFLAIFFPFFFDISWYLLKYILPLIQ